MKHEQALEHLRTASEELLQEKDLRVLKSHLRSAMSLEKQFNIPGTLHQIFYCWLTEKLEERVEEREKQLEVSRR